MFESRRARPSPALIVAVVALVAALAGTAVGGVAVTALDSDEKKQVRKIAKKQAKKQGKAQAKKQIARQITAAATDGIEADINLTGDDQDIAATTITTKGRQVIAVASVELDGDGSPPDDRAGCQLRIAGVDGPSYSSDVPDVGAGRDPIAITFARDLGPGTHPVALRCRVVTGSVQVEEANLSVWSTGA